MSCATALRAAPTQCQAADVIEGEAWSPPAALPRCRAVGFLDGWTCGPHCRRFGLTFLETPILSGPLGRRTVPPRRRSVAPPRLAFYDDFVVVGCVARHRDALCGLGPHWAGGGGGDSRSDGVGCGDSIHGLQRSSVGQRSLCRSASPSPDARPMIAWCWAHRCVASVARSAPPLSALLVPM